MRLFGILLGMMIVLTGHCEDLEMEKWIESFKSSVQNEGFMTNLGQSEDYSNLMRQEESNNSFFGLTSTQDLVANAEKLQKDSAINNYLNQYSSNEANLQSNKADSNSTSELKELLQQNYLNGPKYTINPNEPILLHAAKMQSASFDNQITIGSNSYEEYQCEESVHQFTEKVKEQLVIDFEYPLEKTQAVSFYASAKNEFSVNITADLITGKIYSEGNGENFLHPQSKVIDPLGEMPSGAYVEFRRTIPYSFWNGITESVDTVVGTEPSKENGYRFTFGLAQKNCNNKHKALCNQYRGMQHHWEATIHFPAVYKGEHWKGAEKIQSFLSKGWCQQINSQCLGSSATRKFGSGESPLSIFRDCWEKETTYQCSFGSKPKDGCHELKLKGCEQVNSVCKQSHENVCAIYEQQYRCPVNSIFSMESEKLDLNELNQLGSPLKFEENKDFGEAISALSLTDAFVKEQINREGTEGKFFNGQSSECEALPKQCCAKRGIVKKILGCSTKEEELAPKVQNGLCHLIEETKKGVIHQKKRHYCCFHSKLGRIVQEGAREQLDLDFGSAEIPNCRALSVNEIQKVDWARVDFSEIIQDFNKKASSIKLNKSFQNLTSQKTTSNQKIEEIELMGSLNKKIVEMNASSPTPLNEYYQQVSVKEPHA